MSGLSAQETRLPNLRDARPQASRRPRGSRAGARRVLSCLLIAATLLAASRAGASEKLPLPSADAQRQAFDLVKQVFGDELENAKTNDAKRDLAEKLLEKANEAAGESNRYALLKAARELAAQAGDAALAFQVVDATAERYDVDAYRLRGATLSEAAQSATSEEARYEVQVVGSRIRDTFHTGSLHGLARSAGNLPKDDQWFTLHLVAKGNHLTISIDDQQVVDHVDKANQYQSGYIALQLWNANTSVSFRNLRIKTLP